VSGSHFSKIRFCAVSALLIFTSISTNSFGAETNTEITSIPALQAAIEKILKEGKTPGAGIAIVSRDKAEWIAGLGLADVAANKPVTADTLFRIGSVSKAFAAMAALKLQEEGKLKFTDTVHQWVPDVSFSNPWESTNPVRLVHLMEHTTGFDDMHLREYALSDPTPITLKDALEFGASSRVSRWPPGERMSYCNTGPAVLAAVVEKVSGERFEDYVQEHFFNPLHMDTTSYFYNPQVQQRLSKLYHRDGKTPYPYWHINYRPAGSINASAKDMANYVRFYLQRGSFEGTKLLQPASIERMENLETLPAAQLGKFAGYGLYNVASCEGPFVFHGHGGAVIGGLTDMSYLSEYGRGYAVMINSGNGKALQQISKLLRSYLTRDLKPPSLPPVVPVSPDVPRHFDGYYQGISPRSQRLFGFERLVFIEKFVFTTNGLSTSLYGFIREKWVPVSARMFRKENESMATLALLPDANGEVQIQSNWATFKKISPLEVWSQIAGIAVISLLVLSSFVFAPIWMVRKFFGKLPNSGPLSIRILPLLTAILLVAFDGLFLLAIFGLAIGFGDDFTMGTRSFFTVTLMLASLAFPIATAASVYVIFRNRNAVMNRAAYWHSVLVTIAMLAVVIYYGYWGYIGLRLWT
jgi:CubicO group peptidase (beta-lactamase class C family)